MTGMEQPQELEFYEVIDINAQGKTDEARQVWSVTRINNVAIVDARVIFVLLQTHGRQDVVDLVISMLRTAVQSIKSFFRSQNSFGLVSALPLGGQTVLTSSGERMPLENALLVSPCCTVQRCSTAVLTRNRRESEWRTGVNFSGFVQLYSLWFLGATIQYLVDSGNILACILILKTHMV